MHMHYGVEEMFFVLSGTLTVRTPEGEEELSPGDDRLLPGGSGQAAHLLEPTDEPVRMLGISTKRFPDVVAYPERGVAWVATRHPERPVPEDGDAGVIAALRAGIGRLTVPANAAQASFPGHVEGADRCHRFRLSSSISDQERPGPFAIAAARLSPLWLLVMIFGVYGAGLGWRPGAYFMLMAILGQVGGHLVMGVTEYRRVMRRPWPQVAPLDDDDDW